MLFQEKAKSAFKLVDPDSKLIVLFSFAVGEHLEHELLASMRVLLDLFLADLSGFLQNFQHPGVLDTRECAKIKMGKLCFQLPDARAHRPCRVQSTA